MNMSAWKSTGPGVPALLLEGKDPNRVALRFRSGDRTYGEISDESRAIASYLLALGCGRGGRALVIGDNSFFWVASYLGSMQAGMVCVPLPADISPESLEEISRVTEP